MSRGDTQCRNQGSQFTGDDFMFLFLRLGFLDFETANVLWLGEDR